MNQEIQKLLGASVQDGFNTYYTYRSRRKEALNEIRNPKSEIRNERASLRRLRQFLTLARGVVLCIFLNASALPAPATTNRPPAHAQGFTYLHEQVREVPWSIHVMKIER